MDEHLREWASASLLVMSPLIVAPIELDERRLVRRQRLVAPSLNLLLIVVGDPQTDSCPNYIFNARLSVASAASLITSESEGWG